MCSSDLHKFYGDHMRACQEKAQGSRGIPCHFFSDFLLVALDVPSCHKFKFKFLGFVRLGKVDGPTCSASMSIELEVVRVC